MHNSHCNSSRPWKDITLASGFCIYHVPTLEKAVDLGPAPGHHQVPSSPTRRKEPATVQQARLPFDATIRKYSTWALGEDTKTDVASLAEKKADAATCKCYPIAATLLCYRCTKMELIFSRKRDKTIQRCCTVQANATFWCRAEI